VVTTNEIRPSRYLTPNVLQAIAYWILLSWLVLVAAVAAADLVDYYRDTETYHRLYARPEQLEATGWAILLSHIVAIGAQATGWRTSRTSRIALGVVMLFVCLDFINGYFRLTPACCGTYWTAFPWPMER